MWISDTAIKRPVMTIMLIIAFIVFGVIGFLRLGIALMPNVDFPMVTVSTHWVNSTPEQIEVSVTKVIEDRLGEIEGIKHISSQNSRGDSRITVEFELSRDIESAAQDVRDAVARAIRGLPNDSDAPVISKMDINAQPIMWLAVYGDLPVSEMREFTEDVIKPRIQQKPGVGAVQVGGGRRREVRIWLYRDKLKQYELTVQDVILALRTQNLEVPGGKVETNTQELIINTKGRIDSPYLFNDVIVATRDATPIKISNIGYAEDGMSDLESIVRFVDPTGVERMSIGVNISPQSGANQVVIARAIRQEVENIRKILPAGMYIDIANDNSVFIERAISDVESNLLVGALLASLVILLFLQNMGTAIISALAIPTSIIATFGFMYFMKFTLNTLTMLGLALAVGIVIDDAIIIIENIYRHRESGKGVVESARVGTSEISFAAMSATFALLGVFLPVTFMSGIIGRFFFEFGMTVAFAVFISLVVALTLTPMLASRFLHVGIAKFFLFQWFEGIMKGIHKIYERLIAWTLKHSVTTILIAVVFFIVSVLLAWTLGLEMMAQEDQSRFMVRLETPIDYSIEATERVTQQAIGILRQTPEVAYFLASTGGGMGGGSSNSGFLSVTLKDKKHRTKSQFELMMELRRNLAKIPDVFASVSIFNTMSMGGGRGGDLMYLIQGPDINVLNSKSTEIINELKKIKGITDIDRDLRIGKPELQIKIDRERAADMGISIADISSVIGASFGGLEVGDYTEKGKTYKVRVKAVDNERKISNDISDIAVRSKSGGTVDLASIIDINSSIGPNVINRTDRERSVTIRANLEGEMKLGAAITKVEEIAKRVLPDGYYGRRTGQTEMFGETFYNIIFALILALIFSYMILAAQFESFIHPFSITLSLPLAVVGALGFLWLGATFTSMLGMTINMMFMIGVILLVGLAKKNAILLIDYTNQLRRSGLSRDEALQKACPVRLRPILMTSIATIAATLPVLFGVGEGSESRRPMAIAIFGGMITSTLLTLIVIPAVYRVFDIILNKLRKSRS
ncbi:MAG: efflux RND transporter permease subunit [Planctomycetota bacterium]